MKIEPEIKKAANQTISGFFLIEKSDLTC